MNLFDFENYVACIEPGGIEKQEARGQQSLVAASNKLPRDMCGTTQSELESAGIVFFAPIDDLFVGVQLPPGWAIHDDQNHSMWTTLRDANSKEMALIFYKAAFYDRRAFLEWHPESLRLIPDGPSSLRGM